MRRVWEYVESGIVIWHVEMVETRKKCAEWGEMDGLGRYFSDMHCTLLLVFIYVLLHGCIIHLFSVLPGIDQAYVRYICWTAIYRCVGPCCNIVTVINIYIYKYIYIHIIYSVYIYIYINISQINFRTYIGIYKYIYILQKKQSINTFLPSHYGKQYLLLQSLAI